MLYKVLCTIISILVYEYYSMGVEDKRADAGQNGRAYLARPNFQARTGTGKIFVSLFT